MPVRMRQRQGEEKLLLVSELRAYGSAAAGFGSVDSDLDLQVGVERKGGKERLKQHSCR